MMIHNYNERHTSAIHVHHIISSYRRIEIMGFSKNFPNIFQIGNLYYVGGQLPLDDVGEAMHADDIEQQTRVVFENMNKCLANIGLNLTNLVKLNTYYVYNGPEEEATAYWETMTKVRLEYLPDPGPAATAVRVSGMPYKGHMIQIEGIALAHEKIAQRQRIMPTDSWDWSIAVPLSHGWRIGNHVIVGGQISADKKGKAVDAGDVKAQTSNVLRYIENVLEDAGGDFDDIVQLRIYYKHDGDDDASRKLLALILDEVGNKSDSSSLAISAIGVNLLYDGLMLEIEALAALDCCKDPIHDVAVLPNAGFPSSAAPAIKTGNEIYIAGLLALDNSGQIEFVGDHARQLKSALDAMERILKQANASLLDLKKLNLFYVAGSKYKYLQDIYENIDKVLNRIFGTVTVSPAFTVVRVNGLPLDGALVQVDGVATTGIKLEKTN